MNWSKNFFLKNGGRNDERIVEINTERKKINKKRLFLEKEGRKEKIKKWMKKRIRERNDKISKKEFKIK